MRHTGVGIFATSDFLVILIQLVTATELLAVSPIMCFTNISHDHRKTYLWASRGLRRQMSPWPTRKILQRHRGARIDHHRETMGSWTMKPLRYTVTSGLVAWLAVQHDQLLETAREPPKWSLSCTETGGFRHSECFQRSQCSAYGCVSHHPPAYEPAYHQPEDNLAANINHPHRHETVTSGHPPGCPGCRGCRSGTGRRRDVVKCWGGGGAAVGKPQKYQGKHIWLRMVDRD